MTEPEVGLLYKAVASLPRAENNQQFGLLRSYYLMRCKKYGLPETHFSSKVGCTRCFTEWKKGTQTRVRAIKLSKKQRHSIQALKVSKTNKEFIKTRKDLLCSKEIEQVCSFCKHSTITFAAKPEKIKPTKQANKVAEIETNKNNAKKLETKVKKVEITERKTKKVHSKVIKTDTNKVSEIDVYGLAKDVFSLNNKNNTVTSAVKETKIIKNNKKKKDKLAGLCQKAVLASVKLKQEKEKQNKLNLFLKPSA